MQEALVGSLSIIPMIAAIVLFRYGFKWTAILFALVSLGFLAYGVYAFEGFFATWLGAVVLLLVIDYLRNIFGRRSGHGGGNGDSPGGDFDGGGSDGGGGGDGE